MYGYALVWEGSEEAVEPAAPDAVRIEGRVFDGAGPLAYPDGFVEMWAGDQWARCRTDEEGRYRFVFRKPEREPSPDGELQAPHLNVAVFARGLLKQVQTRVYFPDEEAANEYDPLPQPVPPADRSQLIPRGDEEV